MRFAAVQIGVKTVHDPVHRIVQESWTITINADANESFEMTVWFKAIPLFIDRPLSKKVHSFLWTCSQNKFDKSFKISIGVL